MTKQRNISLEIAAKLILRNPPQPLFPPAEEQYLLPPGLSFAFERLLLFVKQHGFPRPYHTEDLGEPKMDVLLWLADNLVIPRQLGSFQLLILGPYGAQKTLFAQLIASFLNVYFAPVELLNFMDAPSIADVWVIDGITSNIYDTPWAESPEATTLAQILGGGAAHPYHMGCLRAIRSPQGYEYPHYSYCYC